MCSAQHSRPLVPGAITYIDAKHLRETGEVRPLGPYPVDDWIKHRSAEYEAQCRKAAMSVAVVVITIFGLAVAAVWVFTRPATTPKPIAPAAIEQKVDDRHPGALETLHPLNPWYEMLGL